MVRRRLRHPAVVFLALILLPCLSPALGLAAGGSGQDPLLSPPGLVGPQGLEEFWTPDRLAAARPLDLVLTGSDLQIQMDRKIGTLRERLAREGAGHEPPLPPEPPEPAGPAGGGDFVPRLGDCPASAYEMDFEERTSSYPFKTMGRLFFQTASGELRACSGSVISGNIVITAGHCVAGDGLWHTGFVFIPGYSQGLAPFGQWFGERSAVPSGWLISHDVSLDVGMIRMAPREDQSLVGVVGALGFTWNQVLEAMSWTQYAYPGLEPYDGQRLVLARSGFGHLVAWTRGLTMGAGSHMTAGASGGAWVQGVLPPDYPVGSYVNGVVSHTFADCDQTVYSPFFGSWVKSLQTALKLSP